MFDSVISTGTQAFSLANIDPTLLANEAGQSTPLKPRNTSFDNLMNTKYISKKRQILEINSDNDDSDTSRTRKKAQLKASLVSRSILTLCNSIDKQRSLQEDVNKTIKVYKAIKLLKKEYKSKLSNNSYL